MSKRVTLTDFEMEQIIRGLQELRDQTFMSYEVVRVGKAVYNDLIAKLPAKESKRPPNPADPSQPSLQGKRKEP